MPGPSTQGNIPHRMDAPTSGTKWHKEPVSEGGPKKWYEAKSEDGSIFYWNVETNGEKSKIIVLFAI